MALDAATGEVQWETTLHRGVPQEKRHIKATYANQTPATNGEVVVAFFGSEGLFGVGHGRADPVEGGGRAVSM